jgi:large conductance mechanosensitive channel
MLEGFRKFVLRGNVVDLAVGVVIGAAFTSVAEALVADLITPIFGVFGGVPDFSELSFTINSSRFAIGHFINAVLSFLIIAAALYYMVVVPIVRLSDRMEAQEPPAQPTRECPECLSKIPVAARRCAFCSTVLAESPLPMAQAAPSDTTRR